MSLNDRLIIASIVAMLGYFSALPVLIAVDVFFGAVAAVGASTIVTVFYLGVIKAIFEIGGE